MRSSSAASAAAAAAESCSSPWKQVTYDTFPNYTQIAGVTPIVREVTRIITSKNSPAK